MDGEDNPYKALPKMVMMTYQLPDSVKNIAMQGEFNEFDLNVFLALLVKKMKQNLSMKMRFKNG